MDRDELMRRLEGFEWNDFEVKAAQTNVPKDAYETVSAFSNTSGGWLVFGVRQESGGFEVVGVVEVDRVQNNFLSALRTGQKTSRIVAPDERLLQCDGKPVLVFYIPELARSDKPLYLDGDIRRTFVRKGGSDFKCSNDEMQRFLRDAGAQRHDSEPVDEDVERCFDTATLHWYRAEFNRHNHGKLDEATDLEFLDHWGLLAERDGRRVPTCASILLFGTPAAVNRLLPRPVVDFQIVPSSYDEERGEERWSDRIVVEENLLSGWRLLLERFLRHAEKPFAIDSATMQREDQPPDYIAFREATINLLAHQDYADHTRKASIRIFRDRTVFFNPGDAFSSTEQLLEPGERENRNPRIIAAFRRIGLSEQAGTGIRAIFRSWRTLGRVPPKVVNDKAHKTFELSLPREKLLSEEQLLIQAQIGAHLETQEAVVFALATRQGEVSLLDIRASTGTTVAEAKSLAGRLVTQVLLESVSGTDTGPWRIAPHLRSLITEQAPPEAAGLITEQASSQAASMVTEQAPDTGASMATDQAAARPVRILKELTDRQREILAWCESPRSMTEIQKHLGVTSRGYLKREHIDPLLAANLLTLQFPDSPKHPRQAYITSESGLALVETLRKHGGEA